MTAASSISTAPPHSISLAKPIAPGASGRDRWLSTLPSDQQEQAVTIASNPVGEAWKPAPRVSITTPASPTPMPASSRRPGTTRQNRLISTISSGTTAMNTTTRPEPTVCSATATLPIPPASISAPTTSAFRHCRRSGHGAARTTRIQRASQAARHDEAAAHLQVRGKTDERKADGEVGGAPDHPGGGEAGNDQAVHGPSYRLEAITRDRGLGAQTFPR